MNTESRNEAIHEKGFNISDNLNFTKLRLSGKVIEDIVPNLESLNSIDRKNNYHINKGDIIKALIEGNKKDLRRYSRIFYGLDGVYKRACDYAAYLYRYDWYIASEIFSESFNEKSLIKDYQRNLRYLDRSYIKKLCGEIAINTILDGVYYGYMVPCAEHILMQQLPIDRCRSRYFIDGFPAVEFDMTYFNTSSNSGYRQNVLSLFPEEFKKGYNLYRQGKLKDEFGNVTSWYLLAPGSAFKFTANQNEFPLFISALPAILDLDAAQDLDRRKQMQRLLKILVQKLPMNKDGELIFDGEEARDIHINAVKMLANAIGVDILTTFADIDAIDISDKNTATTQDDLEKVERTVFNTMGLSRNLFNTDGNLSLEKSILNDESTMRSLLLQFAQFFDKVVSILNTSKKYGFRFYMLETTQYNYEKLAKLYKEQMQYGSSRMLPMIALGHSQSFILNAAYFENKILDLNHVMLPPLSSNTMNAEDIEVLGKTGKSIQNKNQDIIEEEKEVGRPGKEEGEKSDKTLANEASQG